MNLIPVAIDSIRIGQPLPFHLVDKDGVLLARKSFVIPSRADLEMISQRGGGLFIDGVDGETLHRAYVDQLQVLMRAEKSIGEIAESKLDATALVKRTTDATSQTDWLDLQLQAHHCLRDPLSSGFAERLTQLDRKLQQALNRNPDGTLFALIYLSASETTMYSATHAMLVSVMCTLAARNVLNWPAAEENVLRKAALTMNLSISDLQDKLAAQVTDLEPSQRSQLDGHAERSAALLQAAGIDQADWLAAVQQHHAPLSGGLAEKTPAQRYARLIERADLFGARLSPRATRPPVTPAAAMQACYFDENRNVDEAGAALIKAVGIYPPGTFVKLATQEIAAVTNRSANSSMPRVGVIINRNGLPTVEPIVRDTSLKENRVLSGVPFQEVRVKIKLDRMLLLTQAPVPERMVW